MQIVKWKDKGGIRYTLDYTDQFGHRVRKRLPKGTSFQQAKNQLAEIERAIQGGTYVSEKEIPFFIEIANEWLDSKKASLARGSYENYECYVRLHLEKFHFMKISQIKVMDIEKFWGECLKSGVAYKAVHSHLKVLRQIMKLAVRRNLISSNPYDSVEKPKQPKKEKSKPDKALTNDQIRALLDAEPDPEYHCLYHVAVSSGSREGELFALTWDDIDFENERIRINKTYYRGEVTPPKTERSNRFITMEYPFLEIDRDGPDAMEELRMWKEICPPSELNLVFPNKVGKYMAPSDMIRRHFKPALRRAGLPDQTKFHWLRHTFGSHLITFTDARYVSEQMGHSSTSITQDIYIHQIKGTIPERLKRLKQDKKAKLKLVKKKS